MKWVVFILAGVVIAAAATFFLMHQGSKTYGTSFSSTVPAAKVGEINSNPWSYLDKEVLLSGKIVQQCPTTGCWFVIQDGTGQLRVDLAPSGFALPQKMGAKVKVFGKLARGDEGSPVFVGLGVQLR